MCLVSPTEQMMQEIIDLHVDIISKNESDFVIFKGKFENLNIVNDEDERNQIIEKVKNQNDNIRWCVNIHNKLFYTRICGFNSSLYVSNNLLDSKFVEDKLNCRFVFDKDNVLFEYHFMNKNYKDNIIESKKIKLRKLLKREEKLKSEIESVLNEIEKIKSL